MSVSSGSMITSTSSMSAWSGSMITRKNSTCIQVSSMNSSRKFRVNILKQQNIAAYFQISVDATFVAWYYFNVMFVAHLCYNRSNQVM